VADITPGAQPGKDTRAAYVIALGFNQNAQLVDISWPMDKISLSLLAQHIAVALGYVTGSMIQEELKKNNNP